MPEWEGKVDTSVSRTVRGRPRPQFGIALILVCSILACLAILLGYFQVDPQKLDNAIFLGWSGLLMSTVLLVMAVRSVIWGAQPVMEISPEGFAFLDRNGRESRKFAWNQIAFVSMDHFRAKAWVTLHFDVNVGGNNAASEITISGGGTDIDTFTLGEICYAYWLAYGNATPTSSS